MRGQSHNFCINGPLGKKRSLLLVGGTSSFSAQLLPSFFGQSSHYDRKTQTVRWMMKQPHLTVPNFNYIFNIHTHTFQCQILEPHVMGTQKTSKINTIEATGTSSFSCFPPAFPQIAPAQRREASTARWTSVAWVGWMQKNLHGKLPKTKGG